MDTESTSKSSSLLALLFTSLSLYFIYRILNFLRADRERKLEAENDLWEPSRDVIHIYPNRVADDASESSESKRAKFRSCIADIRASAEQKIRARRNLPEGVEAGSLEELELQLEDLQLKYSESLN